MKHALLFLMGSGLIAGPAFAQNIDTGLRPIEIVGTANPACLIRSPTSASGLNANFQALTGSSGEIRIVEMVDSQTAEARATSVSLQLPIICNSAHLLSVQSRNGGLVRESANQRNPSAGGFSEFLTYTLNANWAGQSVSRSSDAAGGLQIVSNNGGAGNVNIAFSVAGGGTPLVAGSYTDTITVEFRAAN